MRKLAILIFAVAGLMFGSDGTVEVFNRAVSALAAGDYAAAEKGFREVLRESPGHIGAMLNLGVVYSRMERFDDAISLYRQVLETEPAQKTALANLAVAYVKKGAYAEALPVLEKAGRDSAALRDAEFLYQFATGHLRADRSEAGRTRVERLLQGAAGTQALCRVDFDGGRFEQAEAACRKAGSHRDLGKVLVSEHSPAAVAELAAAIKQNPRDAEAQYYMGVALLQDGRTSDAVQYLERAMQLNANFWGTYFYLGRARLELQQNAEAVPLLRKAAEMNARAAVVFYELGRALMAAGKPDEAKVAMQRVRELRAQELDADAQALRRR
jgi:tetratricopeptide (TPR) repeat protein